VFVLVAAVSFAVSVAFKMPFSNDADEAGGQSIEQLVGNAPYDKQDLLLLVGVTFVALILGIQLSPSKGILSDFVQEMTGTVLMVCCTFSPGPVVGHLGALYEWPLHALGVLVADGSMGGPQVNPGVTCAMFVWGKLSALQAIVMVMAQLTGAAIAFPLLQAILNPFDATVGGPSFDPSERPVADGFANEFAGFAILIAAVYGFCTTPLGEHYFIKQPLVAATIRFICVFYAVTGPAVNPALGTIWAFYATGSLPRDYEHYIVYWGAPALAATLVTLLWSAGTKTGVFQDSSLKKEKVN